MTWLTVALTAAVSAVGLLNPQVYRDNLLVASGWRGNDLITLVVATPVLALAVLTAARGSLRAELVRLGALLYVVYNFAFYLFGAALNALFLAYVAIVVLGAAALIGGAARLDPSLVAPALRARVAVRGVAVFLALTGLILGAVHVSFVASFIATGELPSIVVATEHPTHVVGALDLSLVVVPSLVAAWWLWRGNPWGVVLAVLVSVKGALYLPALTAATLAAYRAGALRDPSQAWIWAGIGVGCLAAAFTVLRAVPPRRAARSSGFRGGPE